VRASGQRSVSFRAITARAITARQLQALVRQHCLAHWTQWIPAARSGHRHGLRSPAPYHRHRVPLPRVRMGHGHGTSEHVGSEPKRLEQRPGRRPDAPALHRLERRSGHRRRTEAADVEGWLLRRDGTMRYPNDLRVKGRCAECSADGDE